ncbi:MAG TPA: type II secretion system protein [Candidatus Omnitrophota bacterium]|nr:type II secretion system protein [Candidatus Omnitrophota bacterium]
MDRQKNEKAFTLVELMVVLITISIFAAFAVPNYQKAVIKSHERKAILNLKTIHGANEIYRARAGQYLDDGGAALDLAGINAGFSLDIFDNDVTYSYDRTAATTYTATAVWAGTNPFTVRLNQAAVTAANPCCLAGTCRVASACP